MEYPVNNPNPIVPTPIMPVQPQQPQQPPAPFGPAPLPPIPETKQGPNKSIVVIAILLIAVTAFAITGYALNGKAEADKANAAKVAKIESQLAKSETTLASTQQELSKLQDTTGQSDVDPDLFQAVFFKDGNVYFGKITKLTESTITLENIFYLSVSGGGPVNVDDIDNPTKQISLVKLGKELHGPKDVMYIERKEITFWENLKNDSKVVIAIKDYERDNAGLTPSSSTYKLRSIISDLILQQTINTSNE